MSKNKGEKGVFDTIGKPVLPAKYLMAAMLFSPEAVKARKREQADKKDIEAQSKSGRELPLINQ